MRDIVFFSKLTLPGILLAIEVYLEVIRVEVNDGRVLQIKFK